MTSITELDDVASRALASMILTATADVIGSGGETAAATLDKLCEDTGLVPDVCAAILFATSWLAGTGGLDGAAIYGAALTLEPDDNDQGDTEGGTDG